MRFFLLFIFCLPINLLFGQKEFHYQSLGARTIGVPNGDSITVMLRTHEFQGTIRVSLVTGEWRTLQKKRELIDRRSFYTFAEKENSYLVVQDGLEVKTFTSQMDSVISDTSLNFDLINVNSQYYVGVLLSQSGSEKIMYSPNGVVWHPSSINNISSLLSSSLIDEIVRPLKNRVLVRWDALDFISISEDYGQTFHTLSFSDYPRFSVWPIEDYALTGDSGIYVFGNEGAYSNNLGNSWSYYPAPTGVRAVLSLRGDSLIGLPQLDSNVVKLSVDAGATWTHWVASPSNSFLKDAFLYGDTLFIADVQGHMWRKEPGDTSFQKFLYSGLSVSQGGSSSSNLLEGLRVNGNNIAFHNHEGDYLFYSRDKGSHFKGIPFVNGAKIEQITFVSDTVILASSTSPHGTYRMENFDGNWTQVATQAIWSRNVQTAFNIDTNHQIILGDYLMSTNGGQSFYPKPFSGTASEIRVLPSGKLYSMQFIQNKIITRVLDTVGSLISTDTSSVLPISHSGGAFLSGRYMFNDKQGWISILDHSMGTCYFFWTDDGGRLFKLMSQVPYTYSHGSPKWFQAYSPNEAFFVKGNDDSELYFSNDTCKTWQRLDTLYIKNFIYTQKINSLSIRDTNSFWLTNRKHLIRSNPRSWLPKPYSHISTLSNNEIGSSRKFKLYPNPTTGVIELPRNVSGQISAISLDGKVYELTHQSAARPALDISHLPSGVYYIFFALDQELYNARVLLLK